MNNEKQQAIEAVNVQAYKKAIGFVEPESVIKLYGIKDIKIGFCETMRGINDAVMIRNMVSAMNEKGTLLAQYPKDFELWKLGEISEKTGEFKADLRKIIELKDYVEE